MKWNIPNQLTVSRVFLSAVFFVLLGIYDPNGPARAAIMGAGFVIYVLAGITDVLDGYLARRLNQVSTFGRMVDPIVDKVLVVGAFVMLAGPEYAMSASGHVGQFELQIPHWLTGGMASSVQPWMAVVVLGREFIISGIRGYSESQGKAFPASSAGKIKMLLQCIAIGTVLFFLAWTPGTTWAVCVKISAIWLAVLATVASGLLYIYKARGLLRDDG